MRKTPTPPKMKAPTRCLGRTAARTPQTAKAADGPDDNDDELSLEAEPSQQFQLAVGSVRRVTLLRAGL